MYHLWDLCICVYASVCVPFSCLACFLQAGTHGPHRRLAVLHDSLAPPVSPSLLCSLPRLPHLLSCFCFPLLPLFSPFLSNSDFIISPFFFSSASPPLLYQTPVVDGRLGCHPLSTFPHKPRSASFRLPPEIIHCCWPLTKTTWPLWGLQIKKWNMDPLYSFIDFTGCSTVRWLTHMYTHKHRRADSTQTLWACWKGGFWISPKDTFILTHPVIINQTEELRGHDLTPNF